MRATTSTNPAALASWGLTSHALLGEDNDSGRRLRLCFSTHPSVVASLAAQLKRIRAKEGITVDSVVK
jgi:hypothetical protein